MTLLSLVSFVSLAPSLLDKEEADAGEPIFVYRILMFSLCIVICCSILPGEDSVASLAVGISGV